VLLYERGVLDEMIILVINCGSSSLKYELFDIEKEKAIAKGVVDRIGDEASTLILEVDGERRVDRKERCDDHRRAVELVRDVLTDAGSGVLKGTAEVSGVGHRVVHGGEEFTSSVLVDGKVLASIEKFSELAPLHNPPSLAGIRGCVEIFRDVPQVAVFDTAFHQTMPPKSFFYGVPYEYYLKYQLRRYGFHGTSHRYVSQKTSEILGKPLSELNLITAHLGNGCSMTAVEGGKSVDTSMGFTPLEGLLMGTRCGDIDPAAVIHIMEKEGITAEELNSILNKKSGLLGLSGISHDMRDILEAIGNKDDRAMLAFEAFVYRVIKYAGAYSAVLGRVDAVVFTGGIGENVPEIKNRVKEKLGGLLGGKTVFLTVATDEELLIAKDTYEVVRK
jgi:acetate kinase